MYKQSIFFLFLQIDNLLYKQYVMHYYNVVNNPHL